MYKNWYTVRGVTESDIDSMARLERRCFGKFGYQYELRNNYVCMGHDDPHYLCNAPLRGIVIESRPYPTDTDSIFAGHLLFSFDRTTICLESIAVVPKFRRKRAGRTLVDSLRTLFVQPDEEVERYAKKYQRIRAVVRESNLPAQLFLKSLGYECTKIIPIPWEGIDEDGYSFRYRLRYNATTECKGV